MNLEGLAFQAINGLASASGLFFVAAGLSLIFGVTRTINMAHGSLYMLGTYIAVTLATTVGGAFGFWGGIVASAIIVGLIGAVIEIVLLRRIYQAPELFQLLGTFALVSGYQRRDVVDLGSTGSVRPARAGIARRH